MDFILVMSADPLTTSLHQKLDSPVCLEGWEWMDGSMVNFMFQTKGPSGYKLSMTIMTTWPSAGHFSRVGALDLIHHDLHGLGLQKMVRNYMKSCPTCARAKTAHPILPLGFNLHGF